MIARAYTKTQPIPFNDKAPAGGVDTEPRSAVQLATVSWAKPALGTHKITVSIKRPAVPAEPVRDTAVHSISAPAAHRASTELTAKYLGGGNLSVRSSVTGRHYRFEGHGAVLSIDRRDQLMLRRIEELLIS